MLDDALIGTTLDGRYRIVRLLGTGGMGAVYVADHVGLHQRVAIKLMLGAADADARARFQREARAAARVVNEHVVRVFDVSADSGRSYIAMEYVEGTDLEQALASGPMDVERALAIVRQVLVGVAAIHAAGLVHRDIKPANVLLTSREDGSDLVKIMDFGVAKTVEIGDDTLTSAGHAVGTIAYMAPEQLVGGNVDHRADLYAVGLMLYRMLAGELPSTAFTRVAEAKRGERPATPALRGGGIPPTIADALACVLDPDPSRRFGNASDFAAALDGAPITARDSAPTAVGRPGASGGRAKIATAERGPVVDRSATQVTPRHGRGRTALLAAVAVVGVAVAIIVVATRKDAPPAVAAPAITSTADAAIDHIGRARDAELAGKLPLAIVEYEEAVAQNGPPELLYRLGELSERLGRSAEAVAYYERYLAARPDAPDRAVVLARISAAGPSVDAGVAAVAKDAGVAAPPRDARRPSTPPPTPTPTTASAPSHPPYRSQRTRCECISAARSGLCASTRPQPLCRCMRANQLLCKYPLHTVDGSSDCVDITRDECLGKTYPDDCHVWIEDSTSSDGASCQGFVMESTPVDGAYECITCGTVYFGADADRQGLTGTPCRGFDRKSGALVDGTLAYCR